MPIPPELVQLLREHIHHLYGAPAGVTQSALPAMASGAVGWSGTLFGVAAATARDAWDVGCTGSPGGSWSARSRVVIDSSGTFYSVAATSARNAWTVGATARGTACRDLPVERLCLEGSPLSALSFRRWSHSSGESKVQSLSSFQITACAQNDAAGTARSGMRWAW